MDFLGPDLVIAVIMSQSRGLPANLELVAVKFGDKVHLVPIGRNGYMLTASMAEATDLTDPRRENRLREILETKSVREIKEILGTFGASFHGTPPKAALIENFINSLPTLMANLENNVLPDFEDYISEQTGGEQQGEDRPQQHDKGAGKGCDQQTPFSGKAFRLGEETEKEPTDKDYVKIIVKGKHLETHVMLEMLKWDTIFQVKEKVWRLKNSSKGKVRTLGEEEIFAAVACSNMENKEGVLLENDMTLGEVIGHGKEWGEVIMVVNPRTGIVSNRTDLEMQFIAGGQLQHDITEGEIVDGMEINVRPRKGYKGIIHIIVRDIKMKYHMNEQDTVKQLEDAMTNVLGHDCSPDGLYRLKHLESASLLQQWEPLFATLGADGRVELCVCLLGGGINIKTKKIEQKKKDVKKFKDELAQKNASLNLASVATFPSVKVLETKMGAFLNLVDTKGATEAFDWLFKQLEVKQIDSALAELKGETGGSNNPDVKIKKATQYLFGIELQDIMVSRDTLLGIISTCELALLRAHSEAGVANSNFTVANLISMLDNVKAFQLGKSFGSDVKMD